MVTEVGTVSRAGSSRNSPSRVARRTDIQALRAFAVVAVVAYHLFPNAVRGGFVGVDVFFVISGYLVGGPLVEQALATGRVQWGEFYARRVRRIAPAATVVALAALALGAVFLTPLDVTLLGRSPGESTVSRDGIATGVSALNVWYGIHDTGYGADAAISTFTHFWSLGVEEQFYLVAPIAAVIVTLAARRRRREAFALMSAAVLWGLVYALAAPRLYAFNGFFDPLARAWELGAGAAVAIAVPAMRRVNFAPLASAVVYAASWLALFALMVIPSLPRDWPSLLTVVPVGATCALLAIGARRTPGRLLSHPVVRWCGDRSYSIYLWHWPLLVVALAHHGREPGPVHIAIVVVTTIAAAEATFRWVEMPARRLTWRRSGLGAVTMATAAACVVVLASAGVGLWAFAQLNLAGGTMPPYVAAPVGERPSQVPNVVPANLRPTLLEASTDLPSHGDQGCNADPFEGDSEAIACTFGTSGPLIALFGDSHAAQWFDALRPRAEDGVFRLMTLTADGCPPIQIDGLRTSATCDQWRHRAIDTLTTIEPTLVILSMRTTYDELTRDDMIAEIVEHSGVPLDVLGERAAWVADVPKFADGPAACVSGAYDDLAACSGARDDVLPIAQNLVLKSAVESAGGHWLDMTDYLCDERRCPIVLGDVLVYRDDDHITATFAHELAPALLAQVESLARN